MKAKAIFLLVIFLLNTVVGFGCALAMEGESDDANHSDTKSAQHVHNDHDHHHADGHKDKPITGLNFSTEDHCCKTLVNDLVTQTKLIPESGKVQVVLPIMWLPDFFHTLLTPVTNIELGQSIYVDHRSRPPNEDIRIAIQSFQI